MTRWQKIADDLSRLARDQQGKPEGEAARAKLTEIIKNHPEARHYEPVARLIEDDILTNQDLAFIARNRVSLEGTWTADSVEGAMKMMQAVLAGRIREFKSRARLEAKSQ